MSVKTPYCLVPALLCLLLAAPALAAAPHGSKEEAKALVQKTLAAIRLEGAEKTYSEITAKNPKFIDRDLYPVVYDMKGVCLAHGANARLVGKDLLDYQDADDHSFVKARVEKAKTSKAFWQEYKFADPLTKKIESKEAYCETLDATIVCAGAYKH